MPEVGSQDTLASVIIPSYGRPELLSRAVESVIQQDYTNFELLIIDDCSPVPIHEDFDVDDSRIRIIRHESNQGVCGARNTGIRESDGDIITFLDDDDYWQSGKLRKQISMLEGSNEVGAVYTGSEAIDTSGRIIHRSEPRKEGDLRKDLLIGNFMSISSIAITRDVIKEAGLFDTELPCWEDWEWLIRVAHETLFGVITEPLVTHQRGQDHDQRSEDMDKKIDGYEKFCDRIINTQTKYDEEFKNRSKSRISFTLAKYAMSNGHMDISRKYILKSIRQWPYDAKYYANLILSLTGYRTYSMGRKVKRSLMK